MWLASWGCDIFTFVPNKLMCIERPNVNHASQGYKAVHYAADRGNENVLKLLIGCEVDLNCRNVRARERSHCACMILSRA